MFSSFLTGVNVASKSNKQENRAPRGMDVAAPPDHRKAPQTQNPPGVAKLKLGFAFFS